MSSSPLTASIATAPGASQASSSDIDIIGSFPKDPHVPLDQLNEKAAPAPSDSTDSGTVMDAARGDLRNAVEFASKYLPESVVGAIGSVFPAGTTDTAAVQKNLDESHTPTAVAANSTLGGLGASDIAVAGIASDSQSAKHDNLASTTPAAQVPLPPSSAAISSNSTFDIKSDANAPLSPFSEGLANTYAPANFASTASIPSSSIPPSESIPPPGGAAELANVKGQSVDEGEKPYKPLAEVQDSQASLGAADTPTEPQHTAPAIANALDSTAPTNAGDDVRLAAATLAGTRSPAPVNFTSTTSLNTTQAFAGDSNAPTPAAVPESESRNVGREAPYLASAAGIGAAATAYEHGHEHKKDAPTTASLTNLYEDKPAAAVPRSESTKLGEEAPYVATAAGVGAAATAYEHGHEHKKDATPTASLTQLNDDKPAAAAVEDAKHAQDAEKQAAKEAKAAEKDDKKAEKTAAKEAKAAEKGEKKAEKELAKEEKKKSAAASEAAERKEQLEREKQEKRREQEAAAAALAADKERQKEAKEKVKEEKREEKEAKKEEKTEKKHEKQLEKEEKKEEKQAAKEEKKEEKQVAKEEKKEDKTAAIGTAGALGTAGATEHEHNRERASDTAPGTPPINPARPAPPRSGADSDFPLESTNASLASGIHAIDLDGSGTGGNTTTGVAAGAESTAASVPAPVEKDSEKQSKPYHGPEGLSEKHPGGALPSNTISSGESKTTSTQRSETDASADSDAHDEPKKESRVKHFMDKVKDKLHHHSN